MNENLDDFLTHFPVESGPFGIVRRYDARHGRGRDVLNNFFINISAVIVH